MVFLSALLTYMNRVTARWMFVFLAAAIAFGIWQARGLAPGAVLSPYLLAMMIFAVATSLDVGAFRRVGVQWRLWVRSFLFSYTVFPVLAWITGALLFPAAPLLRFGLLVLAFTPAANTCSVYTGLARGNVALSLSGITLGNVFLPFVLLLVFVIEGHGGQGVSPTAVWSTLIFFVLLPTGLGVWYGSRLSSASDADDEGNWWPKLAPLIARGSVMAIMLFNAAALGAQIEFRVVLLIQLALALVVLELTMYGLTHYWATRRLRLPKEEGRALCFLHATRNTALAIALAGATWGPQVALPAMVTFLIQEPLGAVVASVFAHSDQQSQETVSS